MSISASLEEYLNTIYKLDNNNQGARVTDIAEELNVKKSSTNKALNLLKEEKLVNYEKYKNVTLTQTGIIRAKHINKRNKLFERFLIEMLGVEDILASTEAERLSHFISCHTTAKLEKFIEEIFTHNCDRTCISKMKGR
ncbi:MAG: metal-dependent transcriptional regulator [Clostridia bacterium]|jgi:DtxR family Mn-dependent transcriptional regulator|nr:metal-dependent transcriptional regulator [Clostridia bacterium]